MNSPRGEMIAVVKFPFSRLPDENDRTICPCIFMMTTVLERLQTTKLSGFFGRIIIELTAKSLPRDLNVDRHSVVFSDQTLTLPSEDALKTWWPSGEKTASLTNDVCPRNSFSILPDFKPCKWIKWSNEADKICELSRENCRHVTPLVWAFSNLKQKSIESKWQWVQRYFGFKPSKALSRQDFPDFDLSVLGARG